MSFLDLQVIREKKHLPHMPIVNLPLKEFIHILTAFYHLPISLVPFTHLLIDASKYAQEGLKLHIKLFSPENFTNKSFEKFVDNIHIVKENSLTVEKKPLILVLSYLGSISLQTRTKVRNLLKNILHCCKLQILLKSKTRLANNFLFQWSDSQGSCFWCLLSISV